MEQHGLDIKLVRKIKGVKQSRPIANAMIEFANKSENERQRIIAKDITDKKDQEMYIKVNQFVKIINNLKLKF